MAPNAVSMWPDDAREASTLPSDFDATITNGIFTKEPPDNYNAGEGNNPIFTNITFLMDGDAPEAERTLLQSYSNGGKSGDEFEISTNEHSIYPTGDEVTIRAGSKWHLFLTQLKAQGVPQPVLQAGDISKLFGLRGHWKRLDDAKLLGKERDFADDKRKKSKFPPQTLVLVKLLSLPGEKAVGKSNGAVAQVAPAGPVTAFDLDMATVGCLDAVIKAAKDNKVQRANLVLLLTREAMKQGYEPYRTDIGRRGAEEAFLVQLAEAGLVAYDPAAKPQYVCGTV